MTKLQAAAKDALQVQDAVNLSGIVHSWSQHIPAIWEEANSQPGRGTDWVNHHPINVLFASKVSDLTGGDYGSHYMDAEQACQAIAKGEPDVDPPNPERAIHDNDEEWWEEPHV